MANNSCCNTSNSDSNVNPDINSTAFIEVDFSTGIFKLYCLSLEYLDDLYNYSKCVVKVIKNLEDFKTKNQEITDKSLKMLDENLTVDKEVKYNKLFWRYTLPLKFLLQYLRTMHYNTPSLNKMELANGITIEYADIEYFFTPKQRKYLDFNQNNQFVAFINDKLVENYRDFIGNHKDSDGYTSTFERALLLKYCTYPLVSNEENVLTEDIKNEFVQLHKDIRSIGDTIRTIFSELDSKYDAICTRYDTLANQFSGLSEYIEETLCNCKDDDDDDYEDYVDD